jgi:AcrR family transcriptional regulator
MSLYHHVENKSALLDGMVDLVIGESIEEVAAVESPDPKEDWKRRCGNASWQLAGYCSATLGAAGGRTAPSDESLHRPLLRRNPQDLPQRWIL